MRNLHCNVLFISLKLASFKFSYNKFCPYAASVCDSKKQHHELKMQVIQGKHQEEHLRYQIWRYIACVGYLTDL